MTKYVVFIKNGESKSAAKAVPKKAITHPLVQALRAQGYRKHFVEVDAESEHEAIKKLNEHNNGYLNALSDFSGSIVVISCVTILMAVVYLFF